MAPSYCAVKGCYSKTGGDVSMHKFPIDPARRQVWIDFVRRNRSRDWTPAKRSLICSLHFSPDCYRAYHRYLLEFGFEVPKMKYLEPEAVPTLYTASAKHRDASPASVPTCKRLYCEVRVPVLGRACNVRGISIVPVTILMVKSRDTGTSCESPYELPIVDETSQFSSPDSQVSSDSDSMIAVHMAAEKHDAQTQCCVKVASKNTETSATTKRQNLCVQTVETRAEIGCQTDVTLADLERLEDTNQRVSTPVMIIDSEEESTVFRDDSADQTYAPSWMDSLMDRCL